MPRHENTNARNRSTWLLFVGAAALFAGSASVGGQADWPQWGGLNRNFTSDSRGLASSWPPGGPRQLWKRALGEGHSSILVEGGRLYTMYRPPSALAMFRRGERSQEEAVVALNAANGRTVWEFKYPASTQGTDFSQGAGPHSTPAVAGDRLYVTSSRRELFVLDKMTGRVLWSHDLIKEYGAPPPDRGYACSPLLYKDRVIVTLGGANQAVAAFHQQTGALVWKGGNVQYSPASPILIDVDGQLQVVVFGGDLVAGIDPVSGRMLWTHPHKTDFGLNISTPVWSAGDHLLLISSAYGIGGRALELRQAGGKTTVVEKWHSPRMRVHIGTLIRLENFAYASTGDFGPAFLTAIDVKTGAIAWQDRAFSRAQLLYADGKLIVLDEDGTLGLATVSPQGLKVLARAPVLERLAWTPPTLAGTTLYVRDRRSIAAFELGN